MNKEEKREIEKERAKKSSTDKLKRHREAVTEGEYVQECHGRAQVSTV